LTASSYLDTGVPRGRRSWRSLSGLDEAEASTPIENSFVRAYTFARRAEERAAAKDASGAERDLDSAQQCLESATFDPDAICAYFKGKRWLDGYRGSVYRLLGRPADAASAVARVLPSVCLLHEPSVLSDQAGAVVQNGDLDEGCGMLINALAVATASGTLIYLDRIRGIRAEFELHRGNRAVRQLDEMLAATG
jgi:hypothetical protein